MWRNFATPCKNTTIKGQYLVLCEDSRYVSPIVKYPLQKNLLFIQISYHVVIIRHTTVIVVTVDCKQGHLGAIVLVIARIVRTWLPPPSGCCTLFGVSSCCEPSLAGTFGFLGARLAMGAPCVGGGGGGGGAGAQGGGVAGFATGFPCWVFGLGLGIGGRVICITLQISTFCCPAIVD